VLVWGIAKRGEGEVLKLKVLGSALMMRGAMIAAYL